MQIDIPYIPDLPGLIVLLTETERLRLELTAQDWDTEAEKRAALGQDENADECRSRAEDARTELEIDGDLRSSVLCQTAAITCKDPDVKDREAIQDALAGSSTAVSAMVAAKRIAIERLNPTWPDASGEPQPIPLRMWPTIEEACYRSIDFNMSEDRRFFSTRSRERSPGSSPARSA